MWLGRQRAEWWRAASLAARQLAAWGGEADPRKLIPEPFRPPAPPPRQRTPEERERESRQGWELMDRFFSQGVKIYRR